MAESKPPLQRCPLMPADFIVVRLFTREPKRCDYPSASHRLGSAQQYPQPSPECQYLGYGGQVRKVYPERFAWTPEGIIWHAHLEGGGIGFGINESDTEIITHFSVTANRLHNNGFDICGAFDYSLIIHQWSAPAITGMQIDFPEGYSLEPGDRSERPGVYGGGGRRC